MTSRFLNAYFASHDNTPYNGKIVLKEVVDFVKDLFTNKNNSDKYYAYQYT